MSGKPWEHQLRSYIAPGAPATRRPCDGTESALRIEFGFTPRWYRERCGVDFSERWHLDPFYRRETIVAMRRELQRSFPELAVGAGNPDDVPANIDAVHGALFVSMLFGVPAEYYADNWPAARHAYLAPEAVAALEVPDFDNAPVFAQLMDQMDRIEEAFGRIEGYINWQGVLNTSYRLRGPDIFYDLLVDPPLARHLFETVAHTMIEGMRRVYARQRRSGVVVRHATVGNCLVNMVSPETYREHLLPWDRTIRGAFDHFGIHNCAWNVDPYIEDYAGVPSLGYVDMGLDSDLARARRLCPEARRAVMYTPMDLAAKPLDAIRDDLVRIHRDLGPCDVVMADIEYGTPDERVKAVAAMAEDIAAL